MLAHGWFHMDLVRSDVHVDIQEHITVPICLGREQRGRRKRRKRVEGMEEATMKEEEEIYHR